MDISDEEVYDEGPAVDAIYLAYESVMRNRNLKTQSDSKDGEDSTLEEEIKSIIYDPNKKFSDKSYELKCLVATKGLPDWSVEQLGFLKIFGFYLILSLFLIN